MKSPPNPEWLDAAKRALEALTAVYGFDEVDVHVGPTIRCVNASWKGARGLDYVSLTLPDDGVAAHVYCAALQKLLYGD